MSTGDPASDEALRQMFAVYGSGVAAFLTVILVGRTFSEKSYMTGRIKALQERREQMQADIKAAPKRKKETSDSVKTLVQRLNLLQESQAQKYRELLVSAGNHNKDAVFGIAVQKAVLPFIVGILLFFAFDLTVASFKNPSWSHLGVTIGMYVGFKIPDILLVNARNKRWDKIRKSLPDGLDLLMVCAEAGLTLNTGFERVASELRDAYPELSEELTLTSIEMSFLPEKKKALENLQKRVGLAEVRGIISVLIQTEKYGTPIAQALRSLSSEYRQQRMLRAEQKAARLPAIMTIPMMIFIMPTLFAIVIAPAAINLLKHSN